MFKHFVHLFVCFVVVYASDNVKSIIKRSDIDVQTCIENFDIHKDKIIRTQDSRNMGAKYLNEIDLGSREECLRLCCETDTCDVFVYEEKSPGSCYLFHCGPSEDFKCKFTRHANYSSAVLAVNRHLIELENQIKLTKHEQELNRLRKIEEDRQPEQLPRAPVTRITPSPTPSTTTQKLKLMKEILPIIEVTKPSPIIDLIICTEQKSFHVNYKQIPKLCRESAVCIDTTIINATTTNIAATRSRISMKNNNFFLLIRNSRLKF